MSDDRILMNTDQAQCAAVAQFLASRGIDPDEAPAVLAEFTGFVVGHAVAAGFMTRDEGRRFIEDRLQKRMLAAFEIELGAHYSGDPGHVQWPEDGVADG